MQSVGDDNPIESRVSRKPMSIQRRNFAEYRLLVVSKDRAEYRPTTETRVIYGIIFVTGLLLIFTAVSKIIWIGQHETTGEVFIPFLLGSCLIIVGIVLNCRISNVMVFDRAEGYYWRGKRWVRNPASNRKGVEVCLSLAHICALQMTATYVNGGTSRPYYSYELNIVTPFCDRMNILAQGELKIFRDDAINLAHFLSVPLWDHMEFPVNVPWVVR